MCDSLFFFFKQKTAYEMRISDWSSDVCSSDLPHDVGALPTDRPATRLHRHIVGAGPGDEHPRAGLDRQDAAVVFQQNQRLGDSFARHRQMLGRADRLHGAAVDMAFGKQPELVFAAQNAAHRLRSEERRVGEEGVSTVRIRWSPEY